MSGDVTTQDLTQGGPAVLVALINAQNLIYLPTPLTVLAATFSDPSTYGGDGANTVITVGTTEPATYGAGTVAVHYTRVDLGTLSAQQPVLPGPGFTVGDVLTALNTTYGLDLAQANITQNVSTPLTANGDGSYTQQITAIGTDMLYMGTQTFTFAVQQPVLTANFTSSATYLDATFTDASTDVHGTITTWAWTFGDGVTSAVQNPTHTYAADGTYTVTLTITDTDGTSTAVISHPITVSAIVPTLTAAFSSTSSGYTATFTDASTDVNGTLGTWHWDFGDGATSAVENPTHAYATTGTFTVQLTVTDVNGVTQASVSHLIGISAPAVTASFTQVTTHLSVALTDTSTDTGGTITSWLWNFGDGQTSTVQNPTHLYPTTGSYTVKLTVTDADGITSSSSSVIVSPVAPPITANFTFAYGPDGMAVSFTDTSTDASSSIASWAWDFGDGTGTSTTRNPTYTYTVAGAHTVTLTITDADGETTSVKSETVTPVDTQVAAAFTSAVTGLSVDFTDTSTVTGGTITSWAWTFGDGQSSTQESPTHAYASAGTYTVQLTVMDSTSTANSTITHPVTVA